MSPATPSKDASREGASSVVGTRSICAMALKDSDGPNLVLAGLTTDICLFWAAVDGKKLGYNVTVVADACGTMSSMGDSLTFDRLRGLGITVSVVNQVVTELVPNFGTAQGQKAQKIMADEIISKLGNA